MNRTVATHRIESLKNLLKQRIVLLDGAMGTMIQSRNLCEQDFRGSQFRNHPCELNGCNDILAITAPTVIKSIHKEYLMAGADIIETNSFNSNAISLKDYKLESVSKEIACAAAQLAREAIDEWQKESGSDEMRWVAGSVGPTNRSLSMSPDVNNPAARNITWSEMTSAFEEQIEGLIEGGADVILIETCYDTQNLKAALWAVSEVERKRNIEIPVMVSATLTESGRILSGQTLAALLTSISHHHLISFGLNCGFGAAGMYRWAEQLSQISPLPLSVYPNAGLPNEMGGYDESPETMVGHVKPMLEGGFINILGGCCGTTPKHIAALKKLACNYSPRIAPMQNDEMQLSGLERLSITKALNFVNVGERCNVAGSRKFLRLIQEKNYSEAVEIARIQVENGAQIIDVNMDDAMIDAKAEMAHFLRLISAEPDIARLPFMIDSSNWDVSKAGLEAIQGKCIVNSISLKDGEQLFIEKALHIKRMGAAVVVMAFDETGQADTFEKKISVCQRAYDILTQQVHFNAQDIIFDPNILAIATGIEEHNCYGIDFINAVKWIKQHLPGAKVSGGVSNLSFSFRGNNFVREAIHSVFLYHAIANGMDMAIVNAGATMQYDNIPDDLRDAITDVIFNNNEGATDALIAVAANYSGKKVSDNALKISNDDSLNALQRLEQMIVQGNTQNIEAVLSEAHKMLGSAIAVIDQPLMNGINRVGKLFGEGKLFLPQVVKSARTMKQAVAWLNPLIEAEKTGEEISNAGTVIMATVKGDVHDIGKNIVDVVLRCNGYEVIDLGVMVPGEEIIAKAKEYHADAIGLSGLITPSLEEMRKVAALMQREGMKIPLMIGGATTSRLHTAVKIAPEYDGLVIYTHDAALMPGALRNALYGDQSWASQHKAEQANERERHSRKKNKYSISDARTRKIKIDFAPTTPKKMGVFKLNISVREARELINWREFFIVWKLDSNSDEAKQLFADAGKALDTFAEKANNAIQATYGLFTANSDGDDIIIDGKTILPTMRQQEHNDSGITLSLSDFIAPKETTKTDYIGAFAVGVGGAISKMIEQAKEAGDDYMAILYQTLADRLAEAATEILHWKIRNLYWGYTTDVAAAQNPKNLLTKYYAGIRPAVGYPSLPDQREIFIIDSLMPLHEVGISLTENGAMNPPSSTCGLILAHPESRYFIIGEIGDDQEKDYNERFNNAIKLLKK